MSYSVEKQVAELKAWVGFHEGPNNKNPFSLWHGYGTQFLPWCASCAQYCAVEKGGFVWKSPYAQFGYKGSGYVPTVCRDAQHMGIWRDKYARARPGWQVHFDWNWDGTQDHDETVIADDGTKLVTIGGNTSDAVLYRTRDRKYVAGFVALDEAGQNSAPPAPKYKERDMEILPGVGVPAGRRRIADLHESGLFVALWNNAKVKGMDGVRAGDPANMRRWYPKNADKSAAATPANPLTGVSQNPTRTILVAKRKDGSTYDAEIDPN